MNSAEVDRRRRRLLQSLGALSLAGVLPGCGTGSGAAGGKPVLIVGAGMAGLTAANALNNAGIANIVIEGRDRIGGRLYTKDVGGIPIDLGASWIHNPDGNPMTAFADAASVTYAPADPTNDAATIEYHDAINPTAQQSDLAAAYANYNAFAQSENQWLGMLSNRASYKDGVERFLDSQPATNAPDARRRTEQFIRFLFEAFDAGPWDKASLYWDVNSPIVAYGGSEFGNFPDGGYVRLARAMASGSDIRLSHKVTRVSVRDDGVFVSGLAGAAAFSLEGSHVIVTLPLGVMKARSVEFDPPLPASRLAAIDRIGLGHFEKVAMTFPAPFWQGAAGAKSHLYYVSANPDFPTEYSFALDYQTFIGKPALVAVATADFAVHAAQQTPQANLARMMEILREVYGSGIPDPLDYAVSGWATDEFSLGSYSNIPVGASPADMDEAGLPIGERLLIAGEHTYKERYGYSDGALSSGLREAQRLIGTGTATVKPGPA